MDPNVDLFAGMKKKKKKVTVADAEETPEPSPAPAPAPVDDTPAPVAEAEAVAEVEAPVATPEPSTEKPAEDSGDLFTDLKKKKKKKKDIPLDLVRFFLFSWRRDPKSCPLLTFCAMGNAGICRALCHC